MVHDVEYSTFLLYAIFLTAQANYNPFMDNILFALNWPGTTTTQDLGKDVLTDDNSLVLTTANNEKYRCILPTVLGSGKPGEGPEYTGPPELELLQPLFDQTSCSYRIESYWTYELCHGKYIRQYHEEKEMGKKTKLQEYYLGTMDKATLDKDIEKAKADTAPRVIDNKKVPTKKVEGIEIPYFEMNMTNGTPCDLTKQPRKTALHYVCHTEGKGEIYEFKETSTCEYEVIVLTSLLCSHPGYKKQKHPVNQIRCHSLDGSPSRPRSLDNLELETSQGRFHNREEQLVDGSTEDTAAEKKGEEEAKEEEMPPHTQTPPQKPGEKFVYVGERKQETTFTASTDNQLLLSFVSGDYCIQGGTGWWKHEFCYSKKVTQFHENRDGTKIVILLGKWSREKHVKWLEENPSKKPKPVGERTSVSLYYSGGDTCDITGMPRNVEVKLKCKTGTGQPNAVTIYLVEPTTCQYVLVLESAIFCSIIDKANEYGLIEKS